MRCDHEKSGGGASKTRSPASKKSPGASKKSRGRATKGSGGARQGPGRARNVWGRGEQKQDPRRGEWGQTGWGQTGGQQETDGGGPGNRRGERETDGASGKQTRRPGNRRYSPKTSKTRNKLPAGLLMIRPKIQKAPRIRVWRTSCGGGCVTDQIQKGGGGRSKKTREMRGGYSSIEKAISRSGNERHYIPWTGQCGHQLRCLHIAHNVLPIPTAPVSTPSAKHPFSPRIQNISTKPNATESRPQERNTNGAEATYATPNTCVNRQYQKARLEVLPVENRTRPHRKIPALGEDPPRCPVLVVQVPLANERPPLQAVSGVADAAEDSVGGGAGGDQKVEKQVDGPGPAGGWEVWAGSTGFSHLYGRGKTGAAGG